MEEKEIDLLDLLSEILSHWRAFIILAIVGGLALGSFSYVKSMKEAAESKALAEKMDTVSKDDCWMNCRKNIWKN